ncbi:MAG: hypothetical protein NC229_08495 [Bacteroides sp.]|nr:hypothetical protein [Bacteroidales bacterium]MCM1068717.1 hypothetical protein [Prevotella sp.]MCM1354683.1 hypothetical protein [Bacteroides sp.]MCM1403769.1 hypothetical protein [Bacteroides sp.]MCM1443513.1 hypothetical protein [Muribaculum sp.]
MIKRYIKVKPKDSSNTYILPAPLRDFYASQGAQIDTPTESEIYDSFPNERIRKQKEDKEQAQKTLISHLQDENTKLKDEIKKLKTQLKS